MLDYALKRPWTDFHEPNSKISSGFLCSFSLNLIEVSVQFFVTSSKSYPGNFTKFSSNFFLSLSEVFPIFFKTFSKISSWFFPNFTEIISDKLSKNFSWYQQYQFWIISVFPNNVSRIFLESIEIFFSISLIFLKLFLHFPQISSKYFKNCRSWFQKSQIFFKIYGKFLYQISENLENAWLTLNLLISTQYSITLCSALGQIFKSALAKFLQCSSAIFL